YGPQKRFGEQQCRNNWLLNIDADEEISPELAVEIQVLFAEGEPVRAGYRAPIRIVFPGDDRPRPLGPSNSPVRLYDKRRAGFRDALVHDSVIITDHSKAGKLKAPMHHRSFRSLRHAV